MDSGLLILIIGALGLSGLIAIITYFESQWEVKYEKERTDKAEVVDLSYSARESSTSVHPTYTFGKGGGMGLGMSTHTTPERHIVVLRGKKYKKLVIDDEAFYDSVREGQKIDIVHARKYKQHKETKEKQDLGEEIIALVADKTRYSVDDLSVLDEDEA